MISKKLHSEIESAGFRMKAFKVEHLEEISEGFISFVEQGALGRRILQKRPDSL